MATVQDLYKLFYTYREIKQYIFNAGQLVPVLVNGQGEGNRSDLTKEQLSTVAKVLKKNRKMLKLSNEQIQGLIDQINGVKEE